MEQAEWIPNQRIPIFYLQNLQRKCRYPLIRYPLFLFSEVSRGKLCDFVFFKLQIIHTNPVERFIQKNSPTCNIITKPRGKGYASPFFLLENCQ